MNRARLMEEIAELDRAVNKAASETKLPDLNMKHRSFPISTWISAFVVLGFWAFGKSFLPQYHDKFQLYAMILGALLVLLALWNTFLFLIKGKQKVDRGYAEATKKIEEMQARRRELMKQVAEIDKAGG